MRSVNNQIQQMRGNLDQITGSLEQLRGGGGANRDNQRRSVLLALAQNNCGPQYAAAAQSQGPGNFLNNLFKRQFGYAQRGCRSAIRHLSHRLCAQLRRRLFSDLVRHRARAFPR